MFFVCLFSYRNKVGSLENLDTGTQRDDQHEKREHSLPIQINFKPNMENVSSPVSLNLANAFSVQNAEIRIRIRN